MSKSLIINNTISLLILQASVYIVPLITFPYLVRVLGIETFGLLAFCTATISFFRAIIEYGFNLTATEQISSNTKRYKRISNILYSVITAKLIISIICLLFLSGLILTFDIFHQNSILLLLTFLIVFGDVFFPIWFFQGMENMKLITYIQLFGKFLFLIFIFLFVNTKDDYLLVPFFNFLSAIISAFISLYIIKSKYKLTKVNFNLKRIKYQFYSGWHIFLSRITVRLYTSINTFLLGVFTTNEIVGIYSIVERIYLAIRGLLNPFVQAIFPYLVREYKKNKINYYKLAKKISIGYFIILILFSIITFYSSHYLFSLVSGINSDIGTNTMQIFSLTIIFAIGTLFTNFLVIKNQKNILSKITIICMLTNILLVIPIILNYGLYGIAYLFLFVQVIHFTLQILYNKEIFVK